MGTTTGTASRDLSFDVDLRYQDSLGKVTDRRVTVRSLDLDPEPGSIAGICHLRRGLRRFQIDRLVRISHPVTGEVIADAVPWLVERAKGPQDGVPPAPRSRRSIVTTRFTDGMAEGWAFGVSEAFKAALDISVDRWPLTDRGGIRREIEALGIKADAALLTASIEARRQLRADLMAKEVVVRDIQLDRAGEGKPLQPYIWIETQGSPPTHQFTVGDTFHSPAECHRLKWEDALAVLQTSIQVVGASGEQLRIRISHFANGVATSEHTMWCDPQDLAGALAQGLRDRRED
jgi:hypothetical protein